MGKKSLETPKAAPVVEEQKPEEPNPEDKFMVTREEAEVLRKMDKLENKMNPSQPSIPVEEKKPEEPKPPEASVEAAPQKTMIAQWAEGLDKSKLAMAKAAGLDVEFLINYLDALEKAVVQQGQALNALGQNIKPVIEFAQKVNQAQGQARAPNNGGMGNIGDIVTIVKEAIAGGSAPNPLQDKMNEFMGRILDNKLAELSKPSQSQVFNDLLDQELLKAKAKAAAAVVSGS